MNKVLYVDFQKMSYNRRSGGGGGYGGGNFGNGYGPSGNNNFSGAGNFGNGGGNFNGNGGGGRFNNFNNYGRNPKMSPWESGVTPGGGIMPNVHPDQVAIAISKLLGPSNQVASLFLTFLHVYTLYKSLPSK